MSDALGKLPSLLLLLSPLDYFSRLVVYIVPPLHLPWE